MISDLGFTTLVPIVALVFASAALGDMREDGTLVYLWLRPMDRWPVVVGAWLASITVSLPLTLVPLWCRRSPSTVATTWSAPPCWPARSA